jgi:hypothetical protein
MTTTKVVILIFLLFEITACSQNQGPNIFEASACVLPCWNRIKVGETSTEDALEIVRTLPNIQLESINSSNLPWLFYHSGFVFRISEDESEEIIVEGEVIDNKVVALTFCGELNATVRNLMGMIGYPENVITAYTPDGPYILYWFKNIGISFWYGTAELTQISDVDNVKCVEVFDTKLTDQMMEAGLFSFGYYDSTETLSIMYPWKGFGYVNTLYPVREP